LPMPPMLRSFPRLSIESKHRGQKMRFLAPLGAIYLRQTPRTHPGKQLMALAKAASILFCPGSTNNLAKNDVQAPTPTFVQAHPTDFDVPDEAAGQDIGRRMKPKRGSHQQNQGGRELMLAPGK